jgi:hypothetical protein
MTIEQVRASLRDMVAVALAGQHVLASEHVRSAG